MKQLKNFIKTFYEIVYKKYVENNVYNDKYRNRFIYTEVKNLMNKFCKDNDLTECIIKDIIEFITITEEDFIELMSMAEMEIETQPHSQPPTTDIYFVINLCV